jgi:DNA-binding transcriptional MerR regulator
MPLTDDQVMNRPAKPAVTSLQLFEPDPAIVYPLDAVEHLTQLPRRTILVYCRHGLVSPVTHPESGGYYFTGDAIRELRWIGYLQLDCGVNVTGIKLILNLTGELRRLRATIAMVPNSTRHPHQCWGINE